MLADTIVAESSAPGAGERAVLRLSGPAARAAAALVFAPALANVRAQVDGQVAVRGVSLAAYALVMPGPGSFTGEDTVELHVPGGSLFVQCLLDDLLARGRELGLRAALPGEFTARACRNGRLGLAEAEGVLMVLHAQDRRELAGGVQWLRGGLAREVDEVRARLWDAAALLEAGLDFTADETGAVAPDELRPQLAAAGARLQALLEHLPMAAPGGELLLLGRSNAGKSSLCNALVGRADSLVDAGAGTTRDLLRHVVGQTALWDAPGDLDSPSAADAAALALRDRLGGRAAAALWVLAADRMQVPAQTAGLHCAAIVVTKCDLVGRVDPAALVAAPPGVPVFVTSTATGEGVAALRRWLQRQKGGGIAPGAPLRGPLLAASAAVERAATALLGTPELAAAELLDAVRELAGVDGRHSAEPLLDRIYGRFCLGK
ncbi:MAG: hypothetical protein RL398_2447 [Planctomycetota bacterium]